MSLPPISYKRHRFPPQIIAHAVWLYFRFPLSLRLVEEMRVLRRMECPYRRTKAHYLNCHTGLGVGHSLMPLVLYMRSLRQVFSFDFLIYRPDPHRWFFTTYGKWPPSTFRGDAGTDHSGGAMY
jgi:hypothetical protein